MKSRDGYLIAIARCDRAIGELSRMYDLVLGKICANSVSDRGDESFLDTYTQQIGYRKICVSLVGLGYICTEPHPLAALSTYVPIMR